MFTILLIAMALQGETPAVVIVDPSLFRKPSASDMAETFADLVTPGLPGGSGLIECNVGADGKLSDCSVVEESPTNAGVGRALLKIVRRFRMPETLPDGRKVQGGTIRIPISIGRR